MKNAKRIIALLLAALMALALAGCGSSKGSSSAASEAYYAEDREEYGFNSYADAAPKDAHMYTSADRSSSACWVGIEAAIV